MPDWFWVLTFLAAVIAAIIVIKSQIEIWEIEIEREMDE